MRFYNISISKQVFAIKIDFDLNDENFIRH